MLGSKKIVASTFPLRDSSLFSPFAAGTIFFAILKICMISFAEKSLMDSMSLPSNCMLILAQNESMNNKATEGRGHFFPRKA